MNHIQPKKGIPCESEFCAVGITYLLNINTNNFLESDNIHTHLLKFKPEKNFIYDYWKNNTKYDTDWVPWEWCETKKTIEKNNSIVLFRPSYNTLHAVKLRYNHLSFQRTQIYGNLWYTDVDFQLPLVKYNQFDIKPT